MFLRVYFQIFFYHPRKAGKIPSPCYAFGALPQMRAADHYALYMLRFVFIFDPHLHYNRITMIMQELFTIKLPPASNCGNQRELMLY